MNEEIYVYSGIDEEALLKLAPNLMDEIISRNVGFTAQPTLARANELLLVASKNATRIYIARLGDVPVAYFAVFPSEFADKVKIEIEAEDEVYEIGYFVDKAYEGKGIASNVIRRVLTNVFDDHYLNCSTVVATTYEFGENENEPSKRLQEKYGFKKVQSSIVPQYENASKTHGRILTLDMFVEALKKLDEDELKH